MHKQNRFRLILVVFAGLALAGCDWFPDLIIGPKVVSVSPSDGTTGVPINRSVIITFDQRMNTASAEHALTIEPEVDGTFSWTIEDQVMTFRSDVNFEQDQEYVFTLSDFAENEFGRALRSIHVFSFTTGFDEDNDPPESVTDFMATPEDSAVSLSWVNPADTDLAAISLLFRTNRYPTNSTDGTVVYSGTETSYVHRELENGTTYYYGAFAVDFSDNVSTPATASATPQIPSMRIAVVNPDAYRVQKFGLYAGNESELTTYYSMPFGTATDSQASGLAWDDPARWTGVGIQDDFIGTILTDNGFDVTYFQAEALPSITSADFGLLIIQDPLDLVMEPYLATVTSSMPDLLDHVTSPSFIATVNNYFSSGGNLLLVGDAVHLLANTMPGGSAGLGYGKTITTANAANEPSQSSALIPESWLFIRGNPFCGVDRDGAGTYVAAGGGLVTPGTELAAIDLFNGNDIPSSVVWSDTIYAPTDGTSVLSVRVQGSGEYVLIGTTCSPPVYTVTVDATIDSFMGYTTYADRRIYYIGADSYFDFQSTDYQGTWHAGQFERMTFTTTAAGQQAVVDLVQMARDQ